MNCSRPLVHSSASKQHSRCGTTLLEMLTVMMMGSVVLGGVAVFLSGMWRSRQAAEGYDSMLNSIVRVASQFRDDVHQATSVELPTGDAQSRTARFTAVLPGERKVEYRAEAGGITRIVRIGQQVKHRESYVLPINATARWEVVSSGGNVIGSLLINRPLQVNSAEPSESRTMRIDAVAGLHSQSIALTQNEKQ